MFCFVRLWDSSRHYINNVLLNVLLSLGIICVYMYSYKCILRLCTRPANKYSFYWSRSATCLTMKALLRLQCSWQSGVSFSADLSWCILSSEPILCSLNVSKSYFLYYLFDGNLAYCDLMWFALHLLPATLFLELWKRHRARHVSMWKVYDWCEEEVT